MLLFLFFLLRNINRFEWIESMDSHRRIDEPCRIYINKKFTEMCPMRPFRMQYGPVHIPKYYYSQCMAFINFSIKKDRKHFGHTGRIYRADKVS